MQFFIIGDTHHGDPIVVEKMRKFIEKVSRGKKTALFTEIFMIDEQNLIEKLKKEPELLEKTANPTFAI